MNNKLILHPSRNFLDARNPSSPFAYMIQVNMQIWENKFRRKVKKSKIHAS